MEKVSNKEMFKVRFKELFKHSDKEKLKLKLDVTDSTFKQWTKPDNFFPSVEKLIILSEYFGVSTDYLLGLTEITSPDVEVRKVSERYGLSEAALDTLSDMPGFIWFYGQENLEASKRHIATMEYRKIINLLLSKDLGKQALRLLYPYFFAHVSTNENTPNFSYEAEIDGFGKHTENYVLSEALLRGTLINTAVRRLSKLREEMDKENEEKQ
jgi:transcriptional regulator with XRE-family HTH domain